jgi:exodeoxyribonuclease-3
VKLATWNVNSIKQRLPHLLTWLDRAQPDLLALQELKSEDFPADALAAAGWQARWVGQKAYNGVAVVSRGPVTVVETALPGDPADEQARWLAVDTEGGVRFACLYLPNGNPVDSPKYPYKLDWMRRLTERARAWLADEVPFVLAGDFNVCPTDEDVYDPVGWREDALCRLETRRAFRALTHLGLTDALRTIHPVGPRYSFWDYQAGRWPRDQGLRIDHLLLSPTLADRLTGADVDRYPRGLEKASDHTPVWCELAD